MPDCLLRQRHGLRAVRERHPVRRGEVVRSRHQWWYLPCQEAERHRLRDGHTLSVRQRVLRPRQLHTTDDVHLMDERPLRRSLRNALLCAALSLAGTVAHAQSPSDEAEALIRQGTELRHQDQDAKALPYFEGAYHLSRNPRTAAQQGLE